MDIRLKFINLSNAPNHPSVVFFQKQVIKGMDDLVLAWKVIRNCGYENYHPFVFPLKTAVSFRDSDGNYAPSLEAEPGQAFRVYQTPSGHALAAAGKSASVREIEIRNELTRGAIDAEILKDGRALAKKTAVAPEQKAVFSIKPILFIGVAAGIEEGTLIDSAVFTGQLTKLTLVGIAGADIMMTGGGGGPNARPFSFTLENVSMV